MKKTIQILAGALVVQLALFAALEMRKEPLGTYEHNKALLSIDFDKIDKLMITDAEKKTLTISKKEGSWELPEHLNFPASSTKIDEVLKSFKEFRLAWPVGKTQSAAKQFSVTEDKFERKLVFATGDQVLKTIYLGSSPGFKKVYVRIDGEDLTYSLPYTAHQVSANKSDWLDRKLSELHKDNVVSISVKGVTLKNDNGEFTVEGLPEGKVTNKERVNTLVANTLVPEFDDIVAYQETKDPLLVYTVETKDKGTIQFTYSAWPGSPEPAPASGEHGEHKEAEQLQLNISSRPTYSFKVAKVKVDPLIHVDIATLSQDKSAAVPQAQGESKAEANTKAQAAPAHDSKELDHAMASTEQ
jgi:hypothetical protein